MVTINDVRSRGYDLLADGRLNQGDFETIEASAEQFIEECCNTIWSLIEKNKGFKWANKFKEDMMRDDLTDDMAILYQKVMRGVMLEQVIFIYENGDINANAIKDDTKRAVSPKALTKLYNYGILWV